MISSRFRNSFAPARSRQFFVATSAATKQPPQPRRRLRSFPCLFRVKRCRRPRPLHLAQLRALPALAALPTRDEEPRDAARGRRHCRLSGLLLALLLPAKLGEEALPMLRLPVLVATAAVVSEPNILKALLWCRRLPAARGRRSVTPVAQRRPSCRPWAAAPPEARRIEALPTRRGVVT